MNHKFYVIYGLNIKEMAYSLCQKIELASKIPENTLVVLKPNYVVSKPASSGATTHPEVLCGIIEYLYNNNINNICIMESTWVGDSTKRAYKVCGAEEISKKYGIRLIDLKHDNVVDIEGIKVCKKAVDCGFLINLPVLKGYCQTRMTCAIKNMKGCIPDSEKRAFHQRGLFEPIGHLGKILKPDVTIVDAICGDLSFEEGGNPIRMDRLIAGFDSVLIDSYACSLMGISIDDVPYIDIAKRYGAGSTEIMDDTMIELNTPKDNSIPKAASAASRYKKYITEDSACSACYGSLIHALNNMDEKTLRKLDKKLLIGQGFIGKDIDGIGIGNCLKGCSHYVKGCPPKASNIIKYLKEEI
jgi:uncharacterized protein (DUF362 family)